MTRSEGGVLPAASLLLVLPVVEMSMSVSPPKFVPPVHTVLIRTPPTSAFQTAFLLIHALLVLIAVTFTNNALPWVTLPYVKIVMNVQPMPMIVTLLKYAITQPQGGCVFLTPMQFALEICVIMMLRVSPILP